MYRPQADDAEDQCRMRFPEQLVVMLILAAEQPRVSATFSAVRGARKRGEPPSSYTALPKVSGTTH